MAREQAVAATRAKHGEQDTLEVETEDASPTGKRRGRPSKEEAPVRRTLPKDLPRTLERIEPDSPIWSPLLRHWSERQWRRGCGRMVQIGEVEEDQKTVRWTVFPTTLGTARHRPHPAARDRDT